MADQTYPNLLAKGVVKTDIAGPFDLFALDMPVTTTQDQAGGADIPQFAVCGLNAAGRLVQVAGGFSVGNVTFSGQAVADQTVTINGHVITWKAGGAAGQQVNIGATAALSAQALVDYINSRKTQTGVEATLSGLVVNLAAVERGLNGDKITLAENGTNMTVSAATLTGGDLDAIPEAKAVRVAAQPIKANQFGPTYLGGGFNHVKLIWPTGVNTLAERKAMFAGTPISVGRLL